MENDEIVMKMLFSEDQERMRTSIERMVQKEVVPRAAEIDEKDEVPKEILRIFSEMGIFSILVPEEYGGLGGGLTELCIAMEEVAKGSVSCASYILDQAFGALALRFAGSKVQKEKYYSKIMTDGNVAFAMTEPQAGSDLGGIRTKAERKGDYYLVNGRKCFITNGGYADYYITLVRTDPDSVGTTKGLSFLWIEKGTEGFSCGKKERKMGYRGVPVTELIFEDARVPVSQLLGQEGEGMKLARGLLAYTRTGVAAWAIGNAQGALENAINYIKERSQFGKMISEFQAIRFLIAELYTKIELARSLIYRIASMVDQNINITDEVVTLASMSKWYATDVAMEVTTQAVQMMGGYGYTKEFPVERMMRDAKALQIFEGTNEIQKIIIANAILR
ncbi:MAG TPA: acyl-CoA dehydrogenase [Deltaproteobacteria bacterium]|nr:acyl-CoA dehydrogenase [Deltaproteobacteria bacterium]